MDQTYVIALATAIIVALVAVGVIRARIRASKPSPDTGESQFAVSTEGMKTCPKCGMGNLWTDRSCMSCGGPLKG